MSYIEYPGRIATVLFVARCNFRCPFCHNPELVTESESLPHIDEEEVLEYLRKRLGLLDAVCVTGGEPLLWTRELRPFLERVKELGYLIKVDTNGSLYEAFLTLEDLVDLWGVDFKVPFARYDLVGGGGEAVERVLQRVLKRKTCAEIRTTIYPPFHDLATLLEMARVLEGASVWYWQNFHREKTLSPEAKEIAPYPSSLLEKWRDIINRELQRDLVTLRL
ncbi:anaerobic ribonucleoside-triphosphate reductase activating protein [Candidatus Caldatribacterium sp. SIUC1]|uniref:anaerobic ribonucleoside-triphosphate reductase activating protein n=1 Tax=Candidatus Caldatribacterium sp. SIUC1 TaxID=3418365 RepID=UPI003F690594